jgi:hypothetical protein
MSYVYRRTEDIDREPTAPYVLREPEVPQMFKKVFKPELCGTTSGYQQHRRFKERHCADCQDAYNEYQRAYRAGIRKVRQMANSTNESQGCNRDAPDMKPEITQFTTKIDSTRQHKSGPGMCYQHETGA